MTGWQVFEGTVEPPVWGRATCAILRLPEGVAAALLVAGASRVEGEIAEHPVNLALSSAPAVEGLFLGAGQSLRIRTGIAPGERVEVRLRPAPPDAVEAPEDLAAALRRAGRAAEWGALTPGKRRGLICKIGTAKTAGTRDKRISTLIDGLAP